MPHQLTLRVYYEDTDLAGIVYHANYLKFLERGRSEAVRSAGIDQKALKQDTGLVFVVRSMALEFLRAAQFDDLLTVESRVSEVRGASLLMTQRILLENIEILTADLSLAMMAPTGRPARIPAKIRCKLVTLLE
ncbi:tol-pal system-associated acyl-CoA thioesterase [Halovulum sp. GXIMD14793]